MVYNVWIYPYLLNHMECFHYHLWSLFWLPYKLSLSLVACRRSVRHASHKNEVVFDLFCLGHYRPLSMPSSILERPHDLFHMPIEVVFFQIHLNNLFQHHVNRGKTMQTLYLCLQHNALVKYYSCIIHSVWLHINEEF